MTQAEGSGQDRPSNVAPPMIEAIGLGRTFDRTVAVKELDLQVAAGEVYGFLGPNGAGKTTTMRMLNGLLRPTTGEIRIHGKTYASHPKELRALTGFIPDTPPLYEFLTGRQYIGFVASLYGIKADQRDEDAERWLSGFDLKDRADEICKGYSHGMRKKLHLAAVLVTRPEVLFLDEPTTGLDPKSARRLKDMIVEVREGGSTVFLSTHLLDTADELCDRIGIIHRGSLCAEGTVEDLKSAGYGNNLEEIFLRITEHEAVLEKDAAEESDAASSSN